MSNKMTGVLSFLVIFSWWVWFLWMVTPPTPYPIIPWAIDEPMGIWLEDPYQTKAKIEDSIMEQWQAQRFFSIPWRNPFEQLIYRRETT